MAFKMLSRVCTLTHRVNSSQLAFSAFSAAGIVKVEHDRQNQRFTVATGSTTGGGTGDRECGVLNYRFTGEKEVDLMSTFVPSTFRGQGLAALLSQAALDFVVEENLKARVSCWYIKQYIEEQPQQRYKDFVIT